MQESSQTTVHAEPPASTTHAGLDRILGSHLNSGVSPRCAPNFSRLCPPPHASSPWDIPSTSMALAGNFHGSKMLSLCWEAGKERREAALAHGSSSPKSASCPSGCGLPCPAPWPQKQNPDSLWKLQALLASGAAMTRWSGPSGMALPDSEWRREQGRGREKRGWRQRKKAWKDERREEKECGYIFKWTASLSWPQPPNASHTSGGKGWQHQLSSTVLTQGSTQRGNPQLSRLTITPFLIHGAQLSSFWFSTKIQLASHQGLNSTSNKMSLPANYHSERSGFYPEFSPP